MDSQISISIEPVPELSLSVSEEDMKSPVAHSKRECPPAPVKENFGHYVIDFLFEKEIDAIYRKAEATETIKDDGGYFPLGARCLVGRKSYKTVCFKRDKLVEMKALLLLVKSDVGWLRTNVVVEETEDDSKEWDVEFCY